MREREQSTLARRGFLRGLSALPLIGGSVALIGQPTAAAMPVTDELRWAYKDWLYMEHRMLSFELAGHDWKRTADYERAFTGGVTHGWHMQWSGNGNRGPAGRTDAPQPSTRAAVILSAAGVPLA